METAVLPLAAYQDRQLREGFRKQAHASLDRLLHRLECQMEEQPALRPTLMDLTQVVLEERRAFTGALTQAFVERRYDAYLKQERADCPKCGRSLKAREVEPRTVETLVGSVRLERPYFYCGACRHGVYPLDEALGVSRRVKQPDVQHAGVKLGLEMPCKRASTLLGELTDASMSEWGIHEVIHDMGEGLEVLQVAPCVEEIRAKIAAVAEGRKWKPILVLASDAAGVPSRPESAKGTRPGRKNSRARRRRWKGEDYQAKGFRFYLVDDDRIVHLISWHQVCDEAAFGAALRKVKEAGLIPEDQVRLCAIGDGAPWIWKWVQDVFPSARQILDYYHCSGYLHDVATAQYGQDPVRATQWLEATLARLFTGEGTGVVWGLQRMQPASDEAQEVIDDACRYLEKRLHQIDYGSHRKGGYPIGSGAIESAHRFIGHVRLKRPGAWWYQENSNAVLALRCALYNGTLQRLFNNAVGRTPESVRMT